MDSLSPDDFLYAFRKAEIPFEKWNHKAHLRMAFLTIVQCAPEYKQANQSITTGIQHFNSFHKEKLTVGYHETITRFVSSLLLTIKWSFDFTQWFEMIAHAAKRTLQSGLAVDFETFLHENPSLLQTNLLFNKDLLFKDPKARTEWVPPDLTSMQFPLCDVE